MNAITERSQIQSLAARWAVQFGRATNATSARFVEIGVALATLDPNVATRADVASVLGDLTSAWLAIPCCDECNIAAPCVVAIAQTHLCPTCLHSALQCAKASL